jgi:hypothetical protein
MIIHGANNTPIHVVQTPLQGLSMKPIFDDWDQDEFAKALSLITGFPLVSSSSGKGVASFLTNSLRTQALKPTPIGRPLDIVSLNRKLGLVNFGGYRVSQDLLQLFAHDSSQSSAPR